MDGDVQEWMSPTELEAFIRRRSSNIHSVALTDENKFTIDMPHCENFNLYAEFFNKNRKCRLSHYGTNTTCF